jgi:hypothetical protein
MANDSGVWAFLSRDVAMVGGLESPMLSWLGSCGIVLFFMWHALRLRKETASVRAAFARVHPMLKVLATERSPINGNRFHSHAKKGTRIEAGRSASIQTRIDGDDLHTLDARFHQEPLFRGPWAQYRITLIQEHVPWFMEPRIFSTKSASEVLTQETLFTNQVNLAFYRQLPSLVTGIGLLLTFLALFIGLGKLHADGNEIVGIQGLINGLAGKFLTSIVGLIVANVFTFLENSMVSRLMEAHRTFLSLVDQLFPRKTLEQMVEQLTSIHREHPKEPSTHSAGPREQAGEWQTNQLVGPLAKFTATLHSLTTWQKEDQAMIQRTIAELPGHIRKELHTPLNELTDALHTLTSLLADAKHHPESPESMGGPTEDHPLLWKASSSPRASSTINFFKKIRSWPGRPWLYRQRRTG